MMEPSSDCATIHTLYDQIACGLDLVALWALVVLAGIGLVWFWYLCSKFRR